jgi:hypothetical protein
MRPLGNRDNHDTRDTKTRDTDTRSTDISSTTDISSIGRRAQPTAVYIARLTIIATTAYLIALRRTQAGMTAMRPNGRCAGRSSPT